MVPLVRTLIVSGVLAALVFVGFDRLLAHGRLAAMEELTALREEMAERLAERQAMIDRLSRSRRLAHVEILDQRLGSNGAVAETDLLFIELDDDGSELARQAFTIPGDVLFIDVWTVKFEHDDVARGHPLHGRALVLLRRIYSDRMSPADGFAIDTPGAVPPGYASSDVGRFEQRVWEHFWDLAVDAELAVSMGVRVAQGEAIYKPVAVGQAFALRVDAAGGMSLTPLAAAD